MSNRYAPRRTKGGMTVFPIPHYEALVSGDPETLTRQLNIAVQDGWRFVGAAAGYVQPFFAPQWVIWIERPHYPDLEESQQPCP